MSAAKGKSGAGRPAASSHAALEEAACELAFEQGWDKVSASDIAQRAGVSRSSFFNYFASKADVLWRNVDVALESATSLREFVSRLEEIGPPTALTYIDTMGARDAAEESSVSRAARLAALLRRGPSLAPLATGAENDTETGTSAEIGSDAKAAVAADAQNLSASIQRIRASALASGTLTAILEWAAAGIGRPPLTAYLEAALGRDW
ncbi:TetR/AcrR family transcriptional regulator [Gulosibacter chungangensis]|uniref:TetR family transcriptional regulator n=1 Tax=Gulosibacter chungangensis TaxID=979746 RepID=A0A7J5BAP4_9MICO|nr:helix-turn-helix domain-containing protein [Gulosibacter chungangensis]KAB1641943.1 TetR family transcriptional regulator [Gulosibacter chungangensis]